MDDIDAANDLADNLRNAEILRIRNEVSRVNMNEPCIECGEEIAPARLKALPSARMCISCAEGEARTNRTHRKY